MIMVVTPVLTGIAAFIIISCRSNAITVAIFSAVALRILPAVASTFVKVVEILFFSF